jgi:hypothetical protein
MYSTCGLLVFLNICITHKARRRHEEGAKKAKKAKKAKVEVFSVNVSDFSVDIAVEYRSLLFSLNKARLVN